MWHVDFSNGMIITSNSLRNICLNVAELTFKYDHLAPPHVDAVAFYSKRRRTKIYKKSFCRIVRRQIVVQLRGCYHRWKNEGLYESEVETHDNIVRFPVELARIPARYKI